MNRDQPLAPEQVDLLCEQAAGCAASGQFDEALASYADILEAAPNTLRALHGIGVVLHKLGKSEEGISVIRKALELKPDFTAAYNNLGNIYVDVKNYEAAVDCYQQVIVLEPGNHQSYKNLSLAFLGSGKLDEALDACNVALQLAPQQPENHMMMGNVHTARGDSGKALLCYFKVLELAPHSSNAHTNVLFAMNFIPQYTQPAIYRESRRWEKLHVPEDIPDRPHLNSPSPHRRLRIGYVSGDFKMHPVGYHFKPVAEHHDRNEFEIFLYSNCNRCDEMTRTLMEISDQWRNIESLSDLQVEEMIRLDGIDILIDLSGHTSLNRLLLFARKPAPVQVSWIGYFNTTGMKAINYLISDEITIPTGQDSWFSERIIRLPKGRFCYEPPAYAPEVAPLPALRNGFITFGSFNKLNKITPQTIALWSAVLRGVPNSHFILKTVALGTESIKNDLLRAFKKQGVDPMRIEIRKESPHPEMLAEYGDIDITLDTFPFNGGATTCEALWMGVPVVSLLGRTPISRQTASLLAACGLDEPLTADSFDGFVQIALKLASDTGVLSQLRSSLRSRISASPLCDGAQFTRDLEHALRGGWNDWCKRRKRVSFSSPHPSITAEEYYNAGINRMEEQDHSAAVSLLRLAVRVKPEFAEAYNNLGVSLAALGNQSFHQALKSLRKAIRIDPFFGEAHNNLGKLLREMGHYSQAVNSCRLAVALMPEHGESYINLGNACWEKGFLMDALESYVYAAQLLPASAEPLCLSAALKLAHGDPEGAISDLKSARELVPEDCTVQSNILGAMNYVSTYSQEDIYKESCLWDERHRGRPTGIFSDRCENSERLRIGYLSADFRNHPVGIFFQAAARHHDQRDFEIFCYSNKRSNDEVNQEIVKHVEHWRDVEGVPDHILLKMILHDRIDLLVDLSGHTAGNRLQLISRRIAPVQISWLGYFNTTGLANMDYVIADIDTVPLGCEKWYREKVIRMPDSRFCYTPPLLSPNVEVLPALINGHITFGCFNNIAKLTPEVIESWSSLLKQIPNSRLVLKWKTLSDASMRAHYRKLFAVHGVGRRQLEFRGQSPVFVMRDEYNDIDIALDPFPYSGGVTSCEALWMGVPVITLAGDRPVSRQTTGFLRLLGLSELSSRSVAEYVACAARLADDLERLHKLRQGLRQRMLSSSLCDGFKFTRALEDKYREIWSSWKTSNSQA